ncbi:MAG: type I methionyl aminopeptidase [Dissulfurispiraceae bacterium]|nr:type I methionyl aminopeptidase [Dissulfurispiraceae bacterium]
MITIKTASDIEKMRVPCRIVAEVLEGLKGLVGPGISTAELDAFAEGEILKRKARPAFKGYRGYPSTICASVNDQVVHGIPSSKVRLAEGDIVSIDLGVLANGFYGDAAVTLPVGKISDEAQRLMDATKGSLGAGIEKAVAGNRLTDISFAVQSYVEARGFSAVRAFVGHGIGKALHEDPQVPNFGRSGQGPKLKEGMTLAIEPMINAGSFEVNILPDGWTAVTADGRLSAHYEHTVLISKNGPVILTKIH